MQKKPKSYQKKPPKSNYIKLGLIGEGQFGKVFCGIHRQNGKLAALKYLLSKRFPTNKFLRELRILMTLNHPNIVSCHGIEHYKKGRYLIMEYCEGGTLRDLMDTQVELNLIQGLYLIRDILAGLAYAHQHDIIHCDLKPENILLHLNQEGWTAHITDFGVARLLENDNSYSGLGDTGSPAYMAPERYYGKYSAASDIYAVGVILFELMSGKRPFSGMPGEIMTAHISQPMVMPSIVPEVIRPIIKKAMEKLISRRYSSALDMLQDIKKAIIIVEKNKYYLPRFIQHKLKILEQSLSIIKEVKLNKNIKDIITIENILCLGFQHEIIYQVYEKEILTSKLKQQWRLKLKTDLVEFKNSSFQIYAVIKTNHQSHYALYSLSTKPSIRPVKILSGIGDITLNTIDSQDYWKAIIQDSNEKDQYYLKINNYLEKKNRKIKIKSPLPHQMIALDNSHIMILIKMNNTQTKVNILTRKGKFIYSLILPIQFKQFIPNFYKPYHYFSLAQNEENLGFLIYFKPYRLRPISLSITPDFIISIPEGFALFDKNGEGIIIDNDGQQTHKILLPIKPILIRYHEEKKLLIVTEINNNIKLALFSY